MIKLKIEAFDSGMKPLMRHQKPYFAGHESAVIKSLLNLRGQASGNPIAHVVDDALLNFIELIDSDLGTNILLKYVDPYVEERNRYDETQSLSSSKVPQMSSLVSSLEKVLVNNRRYMMRIQKLEDKVWLCVYHCSLLCRMNRKFSRHYEELKRILVNRIFCIIISNMQGDKVRKCHNAING